MVTKVNFKVCKNCGKVFDAIGRENGCKAIDIRAFIEHGAKPVFCSSNCAKKYNKGGY